MADRQVEISVVMPAYNCRRYVKKAVDSILSQTFGNFEFLIFDDGSTDGTEVELQDLAARDPRIRLFRREHQGYSPLLNEGLKEAKGEFIARMDADDVAFPARFEKQLAYMRAHEDCVALGTGTVMIDEDDRPFTRVRPVTDHADIDARHLRGGGGAMPHPSLMFRKSALVAVGGYRTRFEPSEDLDLLLRLAEHGRLANLPESLLKYRSHSKMTSVVRRDRQAAALLEILVETKSRRGIEPEGAQPQLPSIHTRSMDMLDRRCMQAFHAGFYGTAQSYALSMCVAKPWDLSRWKQLLRMTYLCLRLGRNSDPASA